LIIDNKVIKSNLKNWLIVRVTFENVKMSTLIFIILMY